MVSKSRSGSAGALVREQHLLQRVAAEAETERLERDHLVWRNVPEVDRRAEVLHEPGLRGLRRRLEDEVVTSISCAISSISPVRISPVGRKIPAVPLSRASVITFHAPASSSSLIHCTQRYGREVDLRVLRADLGEDGEVAGEVGDQLELRSRGISTVPSEISTCVRPSVRQPALVLVDLPSDDRRPRRGSRR